MKKTDVIKETTKKLGEAIGNFYDKALLSNLTEAPYGYKFIFIPVYKYYRKIKVKEYCSCEECGNEHYNIVEKTIGVKVIGKKRIRVAKTFADTLKHKKMGKPQIIKFTRYFPIEAK